MFALIWGPTIAAVSVVLDHAEDQGIIQQCLEGLKLAAKMAAYHHVDEVSTADLRQHGRTCMPSLRGELPAWHEWGSCELDSVQAGSSLLPS